MNDYHDLIVQAVSRREQVARDVKALRLAQSIAPDELPIHRRVMETIGTALVAIGTRLQAPHNTSPRREIHIETMSN